MRQKSRGRTRISRSAPVTHPFAACSRCRRAAVMQADNSARTRDYLSYRTLGGESDLLARQPRAWALFSGLRRDGVYVADAADVPQKATRESFASAIAVRRDRRRPSAQEGVKQQLAAHEHAAFQQVDRQSTGILVQPRVIRTMDVRPHIAHQRAERMRLVLRNPSGGCHRRDCVCSGPGWCSPASSRRGGLRCARAEFVV